MSIKQRIRRIEKLEKQMSPSNRFCLCFHKYYAAAINSVYDNLPFNSLPLPKGDFCQKCRKPVNHIDFQTVAQINEIYDEVTNEH